MADNKELTGLANASGYAFQLGVEESLRGASSRHICDINASEHPWHHPETGETGFIDFVVEVSAGRFVVECKRTRDARWLFLAPRTAEPKVTRFKCLWYQVFEPELSMSEWSDVHLLPPCPEAAFCCVRGTGENDPSYLDRIGSKLIQSTEGLLDEELRIGKKDFGVYMSVVVTNAELYVGRFDPGAMDLSAGVVDTMDFEKVDTVRYRKALLASRSGDTRGIDSISAANQSSQRSILVVRANRFASLIEEIELKPDSWAGGFPWKLAYDRYLQRKR